MVRVKICGITNLTDARVAADAGADAFGLIFAESPRRVSPETARDIVADLDTPNCVPVGVFVNESPERMMEIARLVGLRVLQLHGDEPPEVVDELREDGFDVVKSLRVGPGVNVAEIMKTCRPTAFLLDTFVAGKAGGTGKTFDWKIALDAKKFGLIILSGGLGVDNVANAVGAVSPYGVDASSRLELRPGIKDRELVRQFIRLVKPTPSAGEPWPR